MNQLFVCCCPSCSVIGNPAIHSTKLLSYTVCPYTYNPRFIVLVHIFRKKAMISVNGRLLKSKWLGLIDFLQITKLNIFSLSLFSMAMQKGGEKTSWTVLTTLWLTCQRSKEPHRCVCKCIRTVKSIENKNQ